MNKPNQPWTVWPRAKFPPIFIGLLFAFFLNFGVAAATDLKVLDESNAVQVTSDFIDAKISLTYPGFTALSIDSLGKEHFPLITIKPPTTFRPMQAVCHGSRVEYRRPGAAKASRPRWVVEVDAAEIKLESYWSADDPPEPLVFDAANAACHVTLLGNITSDGSIQLPAIMHLPDQGSFRISASPSKDAVLGYTMAAGDRFMHQPTSVEIIFPGATREKPVVKYRWKIVSIYPAIPGIKSDPQFDSFRRDWLSVFQISPFWHMLANHAASDSCAFCCYEYADIAKLTPPLAKNLTALDLVRHTLDNIIAGTNAYGMPARSHIHEFSADTIPSLLIAAQDCVESGRNDGWLAKNYAQFKSWTQKMLATDHNGNGLIEYPLSGNSGSWPAQFILRPANWWDTIGFGHEDAYANALAYRALNGMAQMARRLNKSDDQTYYHAAAEKLRRAYFQTFYDPATGVLAGWRSTDGQLHDYYFLWVNGIAIHYGLVPKDKANAIMDRLLAKMKAVGYTRFDLGLPGNLIPVARKDYVNLNPRWGGGKRDDNSDGFQMFENGGATACFAYFTLAALYDLNRIQDADQILLPILKSFAKGDFQGRDAHGLAKEWKRWDGTGCGYEGFLVDNYYALLAVPDRAAAIKRNGKSTQGY